MQFYKQTFYLEHLFTVYFQLCSWGISLLNKFLKNIFEIQCSKIKSKNIFYRKNMLSTLELKENFLNIQLKHVFSVSIIAIYFIDHTLLHP